MGPVFFENAHFAINIFGALVMFAVAWLYFDAWTLRKGTREAIRVLGFILVSLSYVIHASTIENEALTQALISPEIYSLLMMLTRIPGYLLIIISLIMEPLQPKPLTDSLQTGNSRPKDSIKGSLATLFMGGGSGVVPLLAAPL